jgi:hypothetical protein
VTLPITAEHPKYGGWYQRRVPAAAAQLGEIELR